MIRRRHIPFCNFAPANVRCLFGSSGSGSTVVGNEKTKESSSSSSSSSSSGFGRLFGNGGGGLPNGLDAQKLRAMQEMFNSQPPEKQEEMMKKALEFQKMLGKVPFIGKLSQKNIEVIEQLMQNSHQQQQQQQQQQSSSSTKGRPASSSINSGDGGGGGGALTGGKGAAQSAFFQSPSASIGTGSSGRGPTLDELQRVQLGPEIEALFDELKTMRAKKNSYRDQLLAREEELKQAQRDLSQMRESDASLRARLKKVEQDVLLLNSENMELKDHEKEWRLARQRNAELSESLQRAQHGDAAVYRQRGDALQEQVLERDNALRSLQRKLDRIRRRDPLAKFSLHCSDVARHCVADAAKDAKDAADDAFAALQASYDLQLESAWAAHNTAAARAYCSVARRLFVSRVPYENYDAVISVEGDITALREALTANKMVMEPHGDDGRFLLSSPKRAIAGPFAVALALQCAVLPFRITAACPHVSAALFANNERTAVQYETARASGPGGQAVNVTETHVTAKLFIDGVASYAAEAQDSRSALSNREAATEKLGKARRQQYNEQLAKQQRGDAVARQIAKDILERGGLEVANEVMEMVRCALESGGVTVIDFGFVCGLQQLGFAAAEMGKEL